MTLPAVMAACNPPSDSRAGARARLEAIERTGKPCYRCIANTAAPGAPARCSFLEAGRQLGFSLVDDQPTTTPDPSGFGF